MTKEPKLIMGVVVPATGGGGKPELREVATGKLSQKSRRLLDRGIADAKAGRVKPVRR